MAISFLVTPPAVLLWSFYWSTGRHPETPEGEVMNRPIAIMLVVLIMVGLLFSTYALFQGKFAEALFVYPVLIIAYVFLQRGKRGEK